MTPAIDSDGRPLIRRPTTSSKLLSPWRQQICINIRRRQEELSKGHCLDRSNRSNWSNFSLDCVILSSEAPSPSSTSIKRQSPSTITMACDGLRQRASCRILRQLLRCKIASWHGTLTADGFQGPPEAIYGQGFNDE